MVSYELSEAMPGELSEVIIARAVSIVRSDREYTPIVDRYGSESKDMRVKT